MNENPRNSTGCQRTTFCEGVNIGLRHALISPEVRGENSVLIVCRRSLALGGVSAPAVAPSMPYNFLHAELPEDRLQVMGIRIPDYSRQAQMRKACWDWFCSMAAEVVSDPTVIIGDFNSDPHYSKSASPTWRRHPPGEIRNMRNGIP